MSNSDNNALPFAKRLFPFETLTKMAAKGSNVSLEQSTRHVSNAVLNNLITLNLKF